jgi:hypothetical protein
MMCSDCRGECRVVTVDFGVGFYEYGGAIGFDRRMERVSGCCEAPVLDGLTEPAEYLCEYEVVVH